MKKFIMLVLSALTCLCFVACAPKTVEKAKEKMEAAGYSVELISEDVAEIALFKKLLARENSMQK